jgi:acetate---CoA ligase (ADP-forming)
VQQPLRSFVPLAICYVVSGIQYPIKSELDAEVKVATEPGEVASDTDCEFAPLDRLFGAKHLAVVGASANLDKIGGRPLRYLDAAGFAGSVYPVNPRYDEILGRRCAPTVVDIGQPVDVAVIAVPGDAVEGAIDDCVEAHVPFAIVFSSGFGELGAAGRARQSALVERARAGNVRLVGPNSLGIASSPNGLMASFATLFDRHERLLPGRVGFISQSGALGVFMYALAQDQGLGFSRFVSIGNESDLDVADFLAFMAGDPATGAVGGYLEGLGNGRRFMAAAELVRAAGKPMSFLKVGRSDAGRRAAESHTGSLAGTDGDLRRGTEASWHRPSNGPAWG